MSDLRRIPGVKRYRAMSDGLREIGASQGMQAASLSAASDVARNAAAAGHDDYSTSPRTVTAGWQHERRAGAVVRSSGNEIRDVRDQILKQALGRSTKT